MYQQTRQLDVNGLAVDVVRKRIRRINLTVYAPDGRVRVAGPLRMSDAGVRKIILTRWEWIERHQKRVRERSAKLPAHEFVTGENHFYFGQPHRLEVIEIVGRGPSSFGVKIEDSTIVLTVPAGASRAVREKILLDGYRDLLRERAPVVLARWEEVVGVEAMTWGIKRMKTKWGTCNPRARRIWLSLELAKKPAHCLDYIMVHELTHILEPSHNARFKELMDRFMPDWRNHKKDLLTCL